MAWMRCAGNTGGSLKVRTASGQIATFETNIIDLLQSVKCEINATGGNGTPDNPNPINGYSEANIVNTQNESIVDLFSIDSNFRGTVAFNQHLQYTNAVATRSQFGLNFTRSNNAFEYHIVGTFNYESGDRNAYVYVGSPNIPYIEGHVYLVTNTSEKVRCNLYGVTGTGNAYLGQNNYGGTIKKATASGDFSFSLYFGANIENGTEFDETVKLNLFDLTALFSSTTIADYIYSLEQATAGAGVAFFRSIYPADYYDFDVGTNELVGKITPNATINLGQTVYGGVLDVTRGKLTVNYARAKISDLNWYYTSALSCFNTTDLASVVKGGNNGVLCECESLLNVALSTATINANDNFIRFNLKSDGTAETGNFAVGALVLKDTDYSDVPSMLSALGDYYVLYELATPFDIDLTPVQVEQLLGKNSVWHDANGDTEVKYLEVVRN